jgi:hypothetical protein
MIKAQEYNNSPLSPRSKEIRLQKRLRNVERTFASMPPIQSSSSSSLSPLNISRQILADQTISESSPPDSQISVPSPLMSSNHSKNSFECVKPAATPDDGFLTEADIEKMYSEEADIYFNSLKSANSIKFQKNVDITLEKDEDGKTADPIRGINKKSKGCTTYLKAVDPIREVNKRFKKSGIQKRRKQA